MTQLTDEEHKAQMADMKAFDEQMPCIGIFWYDLDENSLFGVRKKEITPKMVEEAAEKGLPFVNYPHLHRQVWMKEYFRAQAKHEDTSNPSSEAKTSLHCVSLKKYRESSSQVVSLPF